MKKDYIITLEDDKEYVLVNTLNIDNKKYVYLIDLIYMIIIILFLEN